MSRSEDYKAGYDTGFAVGRAVGWGEVSLRMLQSQESEDAKNEDSPKCCSTTGENEARHSPSQRSRSANLILLFSGEDVKCGQQIRNMRKACGMTQAELAKKAGVAKGTIAQYELGLRQPRLDQLRKIAHVFDQAKGGAPNGRP